MAKRIDALATLLETRSHAEFSDLALTWPRSLTLADARRLSSHLEALTPKRQTLRVAWARTVTTEPLDPWIELHGAVQGFATRCYHAPLGLGITDPAFVEGLAGAAADVTVVLLTQAELHPDLRSAGYPTTGPEAEELERAMLARVKALLTPVRAAVDGLLLLAIIPPIAPPALGLFDSQSAASQLRWWSDTQGAIAGLLRTEMQSTLLLDLDAVLRETGRDGFFDKRFWYTSLFPFAASASQEIARRIVALGVVGKRPRAKVIAVDADNTLWGGIVGEDGPRGIALSPEYPGNAFVDFQRRLRELQQRGLLLVLCSKNNPEDVDEVLDSHPHQVLRDAHFAAKRVNWRSKAENLASIAEELNLGLDSFVFVDDSDYECALVRRELPMVDVVKTPARAPDLPGCLDRLPRLEVLSSTAEDGRRTAMYAEERRRRTLKSSVENAGGGLGDYLESLDMRMTVRVNDTGGIERLAQLTQKTNQFNLTTRRYDEQQIRRLMETDGCVVTSFSLADTFGDSGVVGLAILRDAAATEPELDTFLMSCRVIGRKAETAFLAATLRLVRERGAERVRASFLPTRKNRLAERFLPEHGFAESEDGGFVRDLGDSLDAMDAAAPVAVTYETG